MHVSAQAARSSDGARFLADVMTDAERRRLRRLQRAQRRRGTETPHGRLRASRVERAIRVFLSKNRIKAVQRRNALRGRIGRRSAAQRHVFTRSLAARSTHRMRGERQCRAAGARRRSAPARPDRYAPAVWACRSCGAVNDSDINAAVEIARRATAQHQEDEAPQGDGGEPHAAAERHARPAPAALTSR